MNQLVYHGSWERIDKWLTSQFPYARNFFHHIIARDWVSIDSEQWRTNSEQWKNIKKSYKLRDGDVVMIDDLQRYLSLVILEEAPDIEIPILKETDDYMIINKPKWVLSHPNSVRDVAHPSVVGFLYHRFKNLPSVGNFIRSWLIHRLDKETDGLMIVVKSEKWLAHFKKLFQKKSEAKNIEAKEAVPLKKYYRAKCYVMESGKEFLKEIENKRPFVLTELVVPKVPHSVPKIWITKFLSYQKNWDTVLIKLEILTGRTHQIRCHLSDHWLPIIGDYVYGKDEDQKMHLTAWKLEFENLEGEKISLEI